METRNTFRKTNLTKLTFILIFILLYILVYFGSLIIIKKHIQIYLCLFYSDTFRGPVCPNLGDLQCSHTIALANAVTVPFPEDPALKTNKQWPRIREKRRYGLFIC